MTSTHSPAALGDLGLYTQPASLDSSTSTPAIADWGASIRDAWAPSEGAALDALDAFMTQPTQTSTSSPPPSASTSSLWPAAQQPGGLYRYERSRGFSDGRAVSHLSPYLRWGQLSPRLVWHKLRSCQ